ncbi:response regulator [Alteromonas mediterranea]|uniref:histidine kinase n=1 Tax=Alteromonas mediterranea (strain DSM 17117 / CIP 110805 / LMG 28347 / Deep ecotype) TaxID=1774373 RepID=F2G5X4_ALTMD|nr:response regulator [Alteromonas mediterranea]AEA98492.2 chemotaxis protein CheY [Alteromonas mediterranea DE]MEA3380895.1 response regulator [Pseudomonadota bacterium]CAH1193840.1 Sensor histidine kinase RcsC [Alteromonas mediterranea]
MSIRVRYIAALVLIATLVTLSFIVMHDLISEQKQDAENINVAGQQRMLSQRIALMLSTGETCSSGPEREYLEQALAQFKANHQQLVSKNNLPLPIFDIYFVEGKLDRSVNQYIKNVERALTATDCQTIAPLDIQALTELLKQLDYVVTLFEQDASNQVDTVLSIEFYLWLATLALLCIEAVFIFSPMEQTVKQAFSKLTRLKAEAEETAEKARKASKAKSEFLSSMSHELRTPMNGLFGMIELAIDNPEKSSIYLKKAKTAGRQLLVLINDILDVSKIEAGKIKIERAPVDLLQILDDVVSLQRVYCQRKGLEFIYLKDPDLPHVVEGDITRISQILHNLLNNAIKFTERGSVTLKVRYTKHPNGNFLSFDVIDTGIGIASSKLDNIFRKFEQADKTTTRDFGGTGLGLSIAKQLAQLMNGDITVTSFIGQGSTFSFTMAAKECHLPEITVQPGSSVRCAVVDDLQTSREYFEHVVNAMSISSQSYGSAKAFLSDTPLSFDVIILDLSMPEMSGVDLLKQLKTLNPKPFPKVILISAELERLEEESDDEIIGLIWRTHVKPINRRELEHDLNKLVDTTPQVTTDTAAANKKKRILLAEDNEINAEIVKTIMQAEGYKFLHVKNGKDAIDVVKRHNFDLILMDCNMPIMGGIEASSILRNALDITTPIVALTANAFAEDKEECLAAGMTDFMAKPIDKGTLLSCIRKHLAS